MGWDILELGNYAARQTGCFLGRGKNRMGRKKRVILESEAVQFNCRRLLGTIKYLLVPITKDTIFQARSLRSCDLVEFRMTIVFKPQHMAISEIWFQISSERVEVSMECEISFQSHTSKTPFLHAPPY